MDTFKVLLADDDATARYLMQAALEKAGFSVILACDGKEAIRLFDENPADMVMLDVEMPFLDGYGVCLYLRKKVGNEYFIEQNLSHREIASLIATSRQTVTKLLNELRTKDLIDFNRRKIIIRNLEALTAELVYEAV